jgi:hypothetical protein
MRCRFLLLLLFLVHPTAAHAWAWGDTLTVIWKPLPNLPSFARPGDTLTVWANASPAAGGWSANLRRGALGYGLVPAGGGWQPNLGRWVLGFRVPAGVPEEMYDLELLSDATAPDIARHCVKVLPAYKTDFYFAQISDTHLPTHALSSGGVINTSDTTAMADFDAVIADLDLIHPEFVLHTGDLVNEGELEDYLGMYEMSRANDMLMQLRDPIFVVTGNHDIGGWKPTAPPDGTARKNWWRQFGWPFLASPPPGDPGHHQNYSFDYGLFHGIGLETYINNGSYDSYLTGLYGAQSFTAEQLAWLAADVAAVPAGHAKLAFYHYDFGGTNANGTPCTTCQQINPASQGLDGAIWGHNHGVAEGNRTARPFNLGLQAVIDGRRTFRIFRVSGNQISPGPMHKSGGSSSIPVDSLTVGWSGPNDGTRSNLTASVTNRFGEPWEHGRVIFEMVWHDSSYAATGGTIAQTIVHGGTASVYVDCVYPASAITVVNVQASQPVTGVGMPIGNDVALATPYPNPWNGQRGLEVRFRIAEAGQVALDVFDVRGRRVASLVHGTAAAGDQIARWDGRGANGAAAGGLYFVRLRAAGIERIQRIVVVR